MSNTTQQITNILTNPNNNTDFIFFFSGMTVGGDTNITLPQPQLGKNMICNIRTNK